MNLSPLNFRGLLVTQRIVDLPHGSLSNPAPEHHKPRPGAGEAIACWRCACCDEVHDERHWAEECCADETTSVVDGKHHEDPLTPCPVCGQEALNYRDATDCCLWRDIDAHTRWAMADAVEAGSTWAEQLDLHHRATA